RLGCARVLVPRQAGVLSALGCLAADVRHDVGRAVLAAADATGASPLAEAFEGLEREARAALDEEGVPPDRRTLSRTLSMRYRGQSYEIDVPADGSGNFVVEFHRLHRERYGHARPDAPIEIVTAHVAAIGSGSPPELPLHRPVSRGAPATRSMWLDGEEVPAEAWAWESLPPGHRGPGPALVLGDHATALVPPGWRWAVDRFGNLILESGHAR
ncbi:MAG TPA: hydantoinase/oxoprolinase family protein, partial [Gemmatimonadota bacterium]|nr:hydantoinase/oxoprolinase family protein [Gemmatimonadota bacterium]